MKLDMLLRQIESLTGASVFIHTIHPAFLECEELQLAPDQYAHHGLFCRAMKLNGYFPACYANKEKSLKIAKHGRSFQGQCPFGLWELVTPFIYGGELAAVIYAGHLKKKDYELKQIISSSISIPCVTEETKKKLYNHSAFLKEFLQLEIDIWLRSGGMKGKKHDENYYTANTQRFIDCNFMKNVSMSDLAGALRVNPGYLGELLKKHCGKSFRRMLSERRVYESKIYLKLHKNLNIAQIAAICGFEDSNYFSQVFHKIAGCTPREYQKLIREENSDV